MPEKKNPPEKIDDKALESVSGGVASGNESVKCPYCGEEFANQITLDIFHKFACPKNPNKKTAQK